MPWQHQTKDRLAKCPPPFYSTHCRCRQPSSEKHDRNRLLLDGGECGVTPTTAASGLCIYVRDTCIELEASVILPQAANIFGNTSAWMLLPDLGQLLITHTRPLGPLAASPLYGIEVVTQYSTVQYGYGIRRSALSFIPYIRNIAYRYNLQHSSF